METARGYAIAQVFGLPTIRRYHALINEHFPHDVATRVLEIGCGIGSDRPMFGTDYTGVDINPDYIERAKRNFSGTFFVMDASKMSFAPNTFDDAISIATTHHLSDEQLPSLIRRATTAASRLHIVDAILPISARSYFKTTLFRMDRGRYVRTFDQLRSIVSNNSRLEFSQAIEGPLHDVCYIRCSRSAAREGGYE